MYTVKTKQEYQKSFEILKSLLFKTLLKPDYDKAMDNIYIIQELIDSVKEPSKGSE